MVLHTIERGSGFPLLLLHGFPFDASIWKATITKLVDAYRVIAPDLRGHGKTPALQADFSIEDMAKDVIELVDSLKIHQTVIAGHSMGGYVALEVARMKPEYLSGLVLIASHIYPDSIEKKNARLEQIKQIGSLGTAVVFEKMPDLLTGYPEIKEVCHRAVGSIDAVGASGALHAMANRASSEDLWKSIKIPTLVIAGTDDRVFPICESRKFAALAHQNTFVEIKQAGHMPMLEVPLKVAQSLKNFTNNL